MRKSLPSSPVQKRPVTPWDRRSRVAFTVEQARLDRQANPSPNYGKAFMDAKLSAVRWSDLRIRDRREYLRGLIAEVAPRIETPPLAWSGVDWTERHDALRGYEGELAALDQIAAERAAK